MLTRFDSFFDAPRFGNELSRIFQEEARAPFAPAVDIYEDKEAIFVKAELPAVKAEHVQIDVENNVLTLRGERQRETSEKKDGVHRLERWSGSFARSFTLPRTVDAENIQATLQDGVLTVRLPKKAEVKQRRIEVKTGFSSPNEETKVSS